MVGASSALLYVVVEPLETITRFPDFVGCGSRALLLGDRRFGSCFPKSTTCFRRSGNRLRSSAQQYDLWLGVRARLLHHPHILRTYTLVVFMLVFEMGAVGYIDQGQATLASRIRRHA